MAIFQFDSGLFRFGDYRDGDADLLAGAERGWRRQAESMATIDVLCAWF